MRATQGDSEAYVAFRSSASVHAFACANVCKTQSYCGDVCAVFERQARREKQRKRARVTPNRLCKRKKKMGGNWTVTSREPYCKFSRSRAKG